MALETIDIPTEIDGPSYILFFEMDEFLFLLMIVFTCLFTRTNFLLMCVFVVLFFKIYVKYKRRSMRGFYIHYPYRWGITPLNRYFKNGSIQEYKE
jgi:type IV conjugative transfer system protein TraL